jgi:hypothetical protein
MSNRFGVLVALAIVLPLLVTLPALSTEGKAPDPIDRLVHEFIEAFNSGDFDTMASFYERAASTSFNDRRSEQEDRDLHRQLTGMLGKLTFQRADSRSAEGVRLIADATTAGAAAEFRFKLVGDPARIDGFSVGVNPDGYGRDDGGDHGDDHDGNRSADAKPASDHSMTRDAASEGPFGFLTSAKGVHQSQIVAQADGSLLLVWVQKGASDLDLFVARQEKGGAFSHPLRINHRGLNRYTGDEARPSVAVGPDGAVAVAWTAANNDIMLAVGTKYGTAFDASLKLNQDSGEAYRTMPAVAISPDGAAHTIWLDPREAPKGKEEPSDLYYAMVKNGAVKESNLTERQEPTVCGCCRPFITVDDKGRFDIVFRNSTGSGYRDISRITGQVGSFSEPQPTSPPIWKLNGCPSAGPIVTRGGTLWKDASTGSWRMLWSTDADADPAELFAGQDELVLTYSPRVVSGRENWVLVGAKPNGLIVTWDQGAWQTLRDDLPSWASSAAASNGRLILIGNEKGRLRTATQPL